MASSRLHLLLIPLMAPGHIIPMIDMAKLLASRGLHITIVVTPLAAAQFTSVIHRAVQSGLSIHLLQIPFPAEAAGLPPGCETVERMPSYSLVKNFYHAVSLWQEPVEHALEKINPTPNCIICDKHITWTADTSAKLQIPRIIFDGMGCFAQFVIHCVYASGIHENFPPADQAFVVPDLPGRIQVRKSQLPGMFNPGSTDFGNFRAEVRRTELQAYGAVVNSFEELEQEYAAGYRKAKGGKLWCIGPLSYSSKDKIDREERGSRASVDAEECLKWLDSKDPGSVIYACMGSLSRLSRDQFMDLALGLESSGHPFILVVRGRDDSIEEWIVEDGFEGRVKGRGVLIRGWAPQVLILSHCSVGGFLTHCGWNSTLEGICAGVPLVTWPMFGEQFLNEKLVVGILGTGVGVGAKGATHLGEEEKEEYRVGRDGIKAAVVKVMDDEGEQGRGIRKRAKEIGEMANRSVQNGGSSYHNLTLLIQDIQKMKETGKESFE